MAPSSRLMRRNFALPTLFSSSAGGRLQERNAMATTAADVLVETLLHWGVDVVFGIPGDGINGIMEALRMRQDKIRFIQVRHEESAAFAACAYAKFTAKLDGQPVLAVTGHHYHDLIDTHAQQDVDLDRLFSDVAAYSARIMGPAHV